MGAMSWPCLGVGGSLPQAALWQEGVPVEGSPGVGLTSWLIWEKDGFWMCRRSVAIRFRAVLSSTTWGDRRRSQHLFEEKGGRKISHKLSPHLNSKIRT